MIKSDAAVGDFSYSKYSTNSKEELRPHETINEEFNFRHNNQIILELHIEDLNFIEKDLDYNEKVSLIFLLYGDSQTNAKYGLQILNICRDIGGNNGHCSPTTYLQEWAYNKKSDNWKETLIEALMIINAKHILRKLGLNIDDLNKRYVSNLPEVNLFIHPILKGLYYVCEQLDETSALINDLYEEYFKEKSISFTDSTNLEIILLNLLSEHIIEVGTWSYSSVSRKRAVHCNVEVILQLLKKYEQIQLKEKLQQISIRFNFTSENVIKNKTKTKSDEMKSTTDDAERGTNNENNFHQNSFISSSASTDADCSYLIRKDRAGLVLIINQRDFVYDPNMTNPPKKPFEKRHGTDPDRDELSRVFSSFGYQSIARNNLSNSEIVDAVDECCVRSQKYDSLIVCILSHGHEGIVYGSNSIPVKIKDIEQKMLSKHLLNKPKILIVQACQGENTQKAEILINKLAHDGPVVEKSAPLHSDLLVAKSTIPGFTSIRHIEDGSWFIQTLCTKIHELGDRKHLLDILTAVSSVVTSFRGPNYECMVPIYENTFRKHFYLPQRIN